MLYQFIFFFQTGAIIPICSIFCLHFAYRSADAKIDLVNCTKVIFSRWSDSISGGARVWPFYQTAAD